MLGGQALDDPAHLLALLAGHRRRQHRRKQRFLLLRVMLDDDVVEEALQLAGDAPRLGRSLDQRRQAVEGMQLADDAGVAIREPVERRVVLRPRRIVRFLFHIDLQGSGAQPRVRPGSQVERAGTAAIRTMHSSTATRNGTVARNSGPIRMSAATIAM